MVYVNCLPSSAANLVSSVQVSTLYIAVVVKKLRSAVCSDHGARTVWWSLCCVSLVVCLPYSFTSFNKDSEMLILCRYAAVVVKKLRSAVCSDHGARTVWWSLCCVSLVLILKKGLHCSFVLSILGKNCLVLKRQMRFCSLFFRNEAQAVLDLGKIMGSCSYKIVLIKKNEAPNLPYLVIVQVRGGGCEETAVSSV